MAGILEFLQELSSGMTEVADPALNIMTLGMKDMFQNQGRNRADYVTGTDAFGNPVVIDKNSATGRPVMGDGVMRFGGLPAMPGSQPAAPAPVELVEPTPAANPIQSQINTIDAVIDRTANQMGSIPPNMQGAPRARLDVLQARRAELVKKLEKQDERQYEQNEKPKSAEASKIIAIARDGSNAVDDVRNMVIKNGGIDRSLLMSVINAPLAGPINLGPEANKLFSAMYRLSDAELRIRTGAAAPRDEVINNMRAVAPVLLDNVDSANYKLNSSKAMMDDILSQQKVPSGQRNKVIDYKEYFGAKR